LIAASPIEISWKGVSSQETNLGWVWAQREVVHGTVLCHCQKLPQRPTSYKAGQQKQLEQFAARKAQGNSLIRAEMERVTAHYAERIQRNQDQVEREKETLRNWKMQNIRRSANLEVIELFGKRTPAQNASAASSGTPLSTEPAGKPRARPSPIPEVTVGR
jgi:hypothetical protein